LSDCNIPYLSVVGPNNYDVECFDEDDCKEISIPRGIARRATYQIKAFAGPGLSAYISGTRTINILGFDPSAPSITSFIAIKKL